jgi:hypothetical protein
MVGLLKQINATARMKKMSVQKPLHMRSFHLCVLFILPMTIACGKDQLHSPIVGNWKQVTNTNGPMLLPSPNGPNTMRLGSDRKFEIKIGGVLIQSGFYRLGHTDDPVQEILYLADDEYGSRFRISDDTLTLTNLGITTWATAITKYVKN